MKLVYLDTSQLRNLADGLDDSEWAIIDTSLKNRSIKLIISFFHLYDFTQKQNIVKDTIVEYLDSLDDLLWAVSPYDIFVSEVSSAIGFLENRTVRRVDPFFNDRNAMLKSIWLERLEKEKKVPDAATVFADFYDIRGPHTMSAFINLCIERDVFRDLRNEFINSTDMIAKMNKNSAIWGNPEAVLEGHLLAYSPPEYREILQNDRRLFERLFGLYDDFMPSLKFSTLLERVKFGNIGMKIEANDLVDEYHASYAPYCDIMMHDGPLCARALQTHSFHAQKCVSQPSEFLALAKQVS
jgi:hypothetical protein